MIKDALITGDVKNCDNLLERYKKAKVIFHDCEFANYSNGVHTQYHELLSLPSNIRNKTYLYHYILPDNISFDELNKTVKEDGFKGLVDRGYVFELKYTSSSN